MSASDTRPETHNLPPLREVIKKHGLNARKSLGQNFLLDPNLTDKIARTARIENLNVIEVGPGPGGLTRALLDNGAAHVTAIELDDRALPALEDLQGVYPDRLTPVAADALEFDYEACLGDTKQKTAIAANLPYNVATPLLIRWLKLIEARTGAIDSMTLMFQKEVGQRITAQPGDPHYGRLAILSQMLCDAQIVFDVPPMAFTPPPKVVSCVVRFQPKSAENQKSMPGLETLERLTAKAFGQRRKMIRSTLSEYRDLLDDMDIDPTLRAENLEPDIYYTLASAIDNNSQKK